MVDQERLQILRKNARILNPFALMQLRDLRSIDMNAAEELEYAKRMEIYSNRYFNLWKQYGDGTGLLEFSEMMLSQDVEQERQRKLRNHFIR